MTTYSMVLDLPDDHADRLLDFPELHQDEIDRLCPAESDNWQDADDAEFEVELGSE